MTSQTIYECITEKVIANFKPTRLYIKQHSFTGKMYFGKTVKAGNSIYTYPGSGGYWTNHIKKHGKKQVKTLWVSEVYTVDMIYDLVDFALFFSEFHNIVDSDTWANMILENGISGGSVRGIKRTQKCRKKKSELMIGKKWSPEQLAQGRETRKAKKLAGILHGMTGKKLGPKTPEQISMGWDTWIENEINGVHSTKPHGNLGKKRTIEQNKAQSVRQTGKNHK